MERRNSALFETYSLGVSSQVLNRDCHGCPHRRTTDKMWLLHAFSGASPRRMRIWRSKATEHTLYIRLAMLIGDCQIDTEADASSARDLKLPADAFCNDQKVQCCKVAGMLCTPRYPMCCKGKATSSLSLNSEDLTIIDAFASPERIRY